jgi:pimeloyl-ACP methyl ester carboxylesterase
MRPPLAALVLVLALAGCAPAPSPGSHYADVRGIHMYYEVHGMGRVLVLLHGGAGNGDQFEHQVPDFEKHYRLIVPDMCAQGRTSDRPGPLTYHAMAEDVIALMNQLHVRKFDLMGWSDGGNTGIDIAIHHPDRLRHLVTFGANYAPDGLQDSDVAWNDTATWAAFGDGMRQGWTKLAPDSSDYRDAMAKIIEMWKTQPRFTPHELHGIRAKTLVAAGENDVIGATTPTRWRTRFRTPRSGSSPALRTP